MQVVALEQVLHGDWHAAARNAANGTGSAREKYGQASSRVVHGNNRSAGENGVQAQWINPPPTQTGRNRSGDKNNALTALLGGGQVASFTRQAESLVGKFAARGAPGAAAGTTLGLPCDTPAQEQRNEMGAQERTTRRKTDPEAHQSPALFAGLALRALRQAHDA